MEMMMMIFFCLCVFHSSFVKFTFMAYCILHFTYPLVAGKKKRENVPLYFVWVKNHTTQIHSSLFHTIQILIQILLSFKPFPLSFALGFWTCWWQSGPVCCKWWVVKVCLVVGVECLRRGGGGKGGGGGGRSGVYNYIMFSTAVRAWKV